MRARSMLLGVSVALAATGGALQACSGDTESTPAADAGPDVVDSGPKDTGADVAVDSSPCDTSQDFTARIPDASIADGASTTGVCMGCVNANCKSAVDKCNKDCTCAGLADDALECYATSQDALKCGGPFFNAPSSTQKIGIELFGCVNNSCKTECAVDAFIQDAGADG